MSMDSAPLIAANDAGTLDGLFRERVRLNPDRLAYKAYDRDQKTWRDYTWADMGRLVSRWQAALKTEALSPKDRVGLLLPNGVDWVAFEQAALGLGLVVVPLYTDDRPDNIAYILKDAGIKLLLLEDDKQWRHLAPHIEDLNKFKRAIILRSHASAPPEDDLDRPCLAETWLGEHATEHLHERGGNPQDLATIVYTSGTTGRPKGVMLSHFNILSVTEAVLQRLDLSGNQCMLSFLPLSHMFERTTGYYTAMMVGASIAYARSIQQLADDLLHIQPTILIAVPRIFERFYDRLSVQLEKQSTIARLLFKLTTAVGWQRFLIKQGRATWRPSQLLWPLFDRLLAQKVRTRFGGRLRLAASGGAALPPAVARTFIGLGLDIVQGYGMTETSPILTANTLSENDPTSVGKALPGIQLRIGENDELLAKSPGNMLGYWNNHQATSEVIDNDGWLHTGDKARIEDGYVYITGRIKDILVLSNGEKIPPVDMESAITLDPLFEQALVVGEGRPYLSSLVVLNGEQWVGLAKAQKLDPFDHANLHKRPVLTQIQHRIAQALHDFPGYAKIRRVQPLLEPWTIENGLLTPTLKIKRAQVLEQFAVDVDALYEN